MSEIDVRTELQGPALVHVLPGFRSLLLAAGNFQQVGRRLQGEDHLATHNSAGVTGEPLLNLIEFQEAHRWEKARRFAGGGDVFARRIWVRRQGRCSWESIH
jgi:hypothetical protein